MQFLKMITVVPALCGLLAPVAHSAPPGRSLTVCDFVKSIKTLKGEIVNVHGVVVMHEANPEASTPDYMVAECPAQGNRRQVKVKVEYPDAWFLEKPPKGYHADDESFQHAAKIVNRALKRGLLLDRYIATIAGQAFAPPRPSLPPPGLHVTPEGTYDAGITIQGIYDIKIPAK